MSKFDQRPTYHVEGKLFTGIITAGGYTWTARLTAKPLPESARRNIATDSSSAKFLAAAEKRHRAIPAVITVSSEERLHRELRELDPTVAFTLPNATPAAKPSYARGSFSPDARTAPVTKTVVVEKSPYTPDELAAVNTGMLRAFLATHTDIMADHGDHNVGLIVDTLKRDGVTAFTEARLAAVHRELDALNMFRRFYTGKRGFTRLATIPYDYDLILAYRAGKAQLAAPPRPLTDVEAAALQESEKKRLTALAENQVRATHPGLDPTSDAFRQKVDAVIKGWAQDDNPNLRKAGKLR